MSQKWSRMIFSFIITVILAAGFVSVPRNSHAGLGIIGFEFPAFIPGNTDSENFQLVGYYDLRDRQTFFQVTNTSAQNIRIHIQFFDVDNNCFEFNYFDTLTPFDTHVYNVSNLDRNDGTDFNPPVMSGHGIIAVTHVGPGSNDLNPEPVLTGNFRIIDDAGYEYRTNFAGPQLFDLFEEEGVRVVQNAHFNDVDGTAFNDLVVISFLTVANPGGVVPGAGLYSAGLFDDQENPISCPQIVLGCSSTFGFIFGLQFENQINVGVNQFITNSRGAQSLCQGTDPRGFVQLKPNALIIDVFEFIFTGGEPVTGGVITYMGLNDGQSIGSMDHIIQTFEEFDSPE